VPSRPSPLWLLVLAAACTGPSTPRPGDTAGPGTNPETPVDTLFSTPLPCTDGGLRDPGFFETIPLALPPPSVQNLWAAAAAVGDVDGDGRLDVLALSEDGAILFRNPDWSPEPLLPVDRPASLALVDTDGDGDLDLFIGVYGGRDRLFENDGGGGFIDISPTALPGDLPANSMSVSFADVDSDGDLDGLVLTTGEVVDDINIPVRHFPPSAPARLWINRGDGRFDDRGDRLPTALHAGFTLAGGLHDLDRDGAMDLYAVNDFGATHGSNLWLRGDGAGGFAIAEGAHGLGITTTGMGLGLGDVNGDGFDDLTLAYWGGVRVLESVASAEPAWFDTTALRLPDPFGTAAVAWGGELADLDNDGQLDLYMSFGHIAFGERFDNPAAQQDRLYLGVPGEGPWVEATAQWGLDNAGVTRGTVLADLDGDGWLDLVRPSQDGAALLLSRCEAPRGVRVQLHQEGPNPNAIGARVELLTTAGSQTRTVRAGGTNFGSSGPPEAHFGFGDASSGSLRITWPDGGASQFDALIGGQLVQIERASAPLASD